MKSFRALSNGINNNLLKDLAIGFFRQGCVCGFEAVVNSEISLKYLLNFIYILNFVYI